jgi:hypothetical protein
MKNLQNERDRIDVIRRLGNLAPQAQPQSVGDPSISLRTTQRRGRAWVSSGADSARWQWLRPAPIGASRDWRPQRFISCRDDEVGGIDRKPGGQIHGFLRGAKS